MSKIEEEVRIKRVVFSSLEFVVGFLPIFLVCYYLLPDKWKNTGILVFSLAFYIYGAIETPLYIALFFVSVIVNYFLARYIQKTESPVLLAVGIIYDISWLFLFKYSGLGFILPVGISFYTFQEISYLIDVYQKKVPAQKKFVDMAVYIMMFPQLIAGPIVRYSDVRKELRKRTLKREQVLDGVKLFIIGMGFKVLLANRIGTLWKEVCTIGADSISTPLAWMGILAFSMQIYFDFNGYSLMAIGLGKMIGFQFPKNFDNPYVSVTMTEFWRRWHMTLGSWFREYVYIPLGGNRKGTARTFFNLFVVWTLTGVWHGASLNFLVWGLFLFIVIALEKLVLYSFFEKHRMLGHGYMMFLIPLSWLIFESKNMGFFITYLKSLFGFTGEYVFAEDYLKYGKIYGIFFVIGLLFCTPYMEKLYEKIKNTPLILPVCSAIFCGCILCMYMGLDDPFLYFRF